jgi:Family of unknown function (DUF5684)
MNGIWVIIWIAFVVLEIASLWMVFDKAGEPGWAAIIPIYNLIVLLRIVGRPIWWIVLWLIPIVNLIVYIIVLVDLCKSFSLGGGFAVGLFFLPFIFYPILGFGAATYAGAAGPEGRTMTPQVSMGYQQPVPPPPPPPPASPSASG